MQQQTNQITMTSIIKYLLLLFIFSFIFSSCQDDMADIPNDDNSEIISPESPLAKLVKKVTSHDGSVDNIIDLSNCISVGLPVTVILYESEVVIESEEDIQEIEWLYEEIDDLTFIFPITLVLNDYSEITVQNEEQLESILEECNEEEAETKCIDFEYPVSVAIYDSMNEVMETKTFHNDQRLYHFFDELNKNEFVNFIFPLVLVDSEGTEIIIENNDDLEEALQSAQSNCNDDEDNDEDYELESVNEYLLKCPLRILNIKSGGESFTSEYNKSHFIFSGSGLVEAEIDDENVEGSWETVVTEDGIKMELYFESLPEFSKEWLVFDINNGRVKFYGDEKDMMILKQDCDEDGDDENENNEEDED